MHVQISSHSTKSQMHEHVSTHKYSAKFIQSLMHQGGVMCWFPDMGLHWGWLVSPPQMPTIFFSYPCYESFIYKSLSFTVSLPQPIKHSVCLGNYYVIIICPSSCSLDSLLMIGFLQGQHNTTTQAQWQRKPIYYDKWLWYCWWKPSGVLPTSTYSQFPSTQSDVGFTLHIIAECFSYRVSGTHNTFTSLQIQWPPPTCSKSPPGAPPLSWAYLTQWGNILSRGEEKPEWFCGTLQIWIMSLPCSC